MNKYEFEATYFDLKTEEQDSFTLTVEANTKWGAWTKALYSAMEKEEGDNVLLKIIFIFAIEGR